jgi:hypothetical protein
MVRIRNPVIAILRLATTTNIVAALRDNARRPKRRPY